MPQRVSTLAKRHNSETAISTLLTVRPLPLPLNCWFLATALVWALYALASRSHWCGVVASACVVQQLLVSSLSNSSPTHLLLLLFKEIRAPHVRQRTRSTKWLEPFLVVHMCGHILHIIAGH